jgi:hypothetical protein
MICPQDIAVCGKKDLFVLKKPASRAVVTELGISIKADIPAG